MDGGLKSALAKMDGCLVMGQRVGSRDSCDFFFSFFSSLGEEDFWVVVVWLVGE